jgi:hypothetical protein
MYIYERFGRPDAQFTNQFVNAHAFPETNDDLQKKEATHKVLFPSVRLAIFHSLNSFACPIGHRRTRPAAVAGVVGGSALESSLALARPHRSFGRHGCSTRLKLPARGVALTPSTAPIHKQVKTDTMLRSVLGLPRRAGAAAALNKVSPFSRNKGGGG